MIRAAAAVAVLFAAVSGAVQAQTVVDGRGVRTGGVVVDASGVHAPGLDVTAGGVRTRSSSMTTTTRHVETQGEGGAGVKVVQNHRTASMDCHGGPAEILGNNNTLSLSHCSRLLLPGNGNHVTVSLVGKAAVDVPGNHNTVSYRGEGAARPRTSVLGTGNHVSASR